MFDLFLFATLVVLLCTEVATGVMVVVEVVVKVVRR
jgi:hypothetical protein